MEGLQEIPRSISMPVLNREEAVIKKVQEQDGIISLMQTQIEFQNEVISKHDKLFEDVMSKIQDLTSKMKEFEDILNKQKESAERDAQKSALWTSSNGASNDDKSVSIADMVKATAEQTLGAESGYIYDEKLGLYFDQSSGYYYDPVKQLFYNGHTKTYYSYDETTSTYHVQPMESVKRKKGKSKKMSKKVVKQDELPNSELTKGGESNAKNDVKSDTANQVEDTSEDHIDANSSSPQEHTDKAATSDMEEGELDSSAPTSAESSPATSDTSNDQLDDDDEQSHNQTNYPPCIRAVVQSSSIGSIKKGTLFLVPYTGGSIGSKGNQHAVLLPTESIDKEHAKIFFQTENGEDADEAPTDTGKYFIVDLGSKEGTYLNRSRVSESGIPSEPCELVHGSTLQVGDVTLLIHIHPGDFTCGHCEPGLILQKDPMYEYTAGESAQSVRKTEMKKMKKKYGLDRRNEGVHVSTSESKYVDRAQTRRKKIGSDNPFAKTEVTTTETRIGESNKGFKMLQKMGWKGESLGNPANSGIQEPIACEVKNDRGGLGLNNPILAASTSTLGKYDKKTERLDKTIERFKVADSSPKPTESFDY